MLTVLGLLVGALLGLATSPAVVRTAGPLLTPTPTAEAELAILQYVVATYPNMYCQGPTGSPGRRRIDDCYPFQYGTHPSDGFVDGYTDPAAAQTEWLNRRQAATAYPIFFDLSYGGYPGYQAGNSAYPYAHTENYLWGQRWVLGATSIDDTNFRGSPQLAGIIFQAAQTLGYLPANPTTTATSTPDGPTVTATSTPTNPTPTASGTATATSTPSGPTSTAAATNTRYPTATRTQQACILYPPAAYSSCNAPGTYNYTFYYETNRYCSVTYNITVYFNVAPSNSGPWTTYDSRTFQQIFDRYTTIEGSFTALNIPEQYGWYRFLLTGVPVGTSPAAELCRPTASATPTVTATPSDTATATATPSHTATPTAAPSRTVTATASPCPITFSDLPPTSPFYAAVRCLACQGVISGYGDGTFRPFNNMTRSQLTKLAALLAGWNDEVPANRQTFADVAADNPFRLVIERAVLRGVVGGYGCGGPGEPCDGQNRPYFRPYSNITRSQASKVISLAAGFADPPGAQVFSDLDPTHPFYTWVQQLAVRGLVSGYGCGSPGEPCDGQNRPYFRPYNNITRGQAAKVLGGAFNCEGLGVRD